MICKQCGTDNEKNLGKCINCGAKLSSPKGFGNNMIEISASSFVMLAFSIIAVICLVIPGTLSFDAIAIIREPLTDTDKLSLEYIRNNQTLSYEKEHLDKMISGEEPTVKYVRFGYNEAIEVLTKLKDDPNSTEDKSRIDGNIAELRGIKTEADEKRAELTELQNKLALFEGPYKNLNSEYTELEKLRDKNISDMTDEEKNRLADIENLMQDLKDKMDRLKREMEPLERNISVVSQKLIEKEKELEDRQNEIILSYNSIYAGALGGVVHEHNTDFKPFLNMFAPVMTIIMIMSFVLTIAVWFTKLYRWRLITSISNIILTIISLFVPLCVWTIEYKWDLSVKNWIIYGIKTNICFAFVLLCSVAVLITGVAYISSQMTNTKTN